MAATQPHLLPLASTPPDHPSLSSSSVLPALHPELLLHQMQGVPLSYMTSPNHGCHQHLATQLIANAMVQAMCLSTAHYREDVGCNIGLQCPCISLVKCVEA